LIIAAQYQVEYGNCVEDQCDHSEVEVEKFSSRTGERCETLSRVDDVVGREWETSLDSIPFHLSAKYLGTGYAED